MSVSAKVGVCFLDLEKADRWDSFGVWRRLHIAFAQELEAEDILVEVSHNLDVVDIENDFSESDKSNHGGRLLFCQAHRESDGGWPVISLTLVELSSSGSHAGPHDFNLSEFCGFWIVFAFAIRSEIK